MFLHKFLNAMYYVKLKDNFTTHELWLSTQSNVDVGNISNKKHC